MSYKINGVEYEFWSVKNQQIIGKLVGREVYCCMTSEMEYMLGNVESDACSDRNNPFDESDLEQMYVHECPGCGLYEEFESIAIEDIPDEKLKASDDTYECPVCGMEYTTAQEAKECCGEDTEVYRCTCCGKILSEEEYNDSLCPAEIYEWWAVSHWFGEKLRGQGQVVIESWGKSYWGRCTTGQSISLDGCIVNIAKDMEILDGMENEWNV